MNPVQKAIIPGILIGVLTLVGLSRLVTPPLTVSAATEEVQNAAVQETHSSNATCKFQERYPTKILPWCSLIETAADKYGMDALLIAAVMLQESGGQPEVMSGSGAVGLMQVMPRDGIAATFQSDSRTAARSSQASRNSSGMRSMSCCTRSSTALFMAVSFQLAMGRPAR